MVSHIFSVMHGIILPIDELIFFKMVIAPPTSYVLWPTMKHYQPLLTIINQYSSPAFFRWAQSVAITLPG